MMPCLMGGGKITRALPFTAQHKRATDTQRPSCYRAARAEVTHELHCHRIEGTTSVCKCEVDR